MDTKKAIDFVRMCVTSHVKHSCNSDEGRRVVYQMEQVVALLESKTAKPGNLESKVK